MAKHTVHLQHHFASPVERVFDFFADHEQFGRIWPGQTRRVQEGQQEPNGVGSVRQIQLGPVQFEETIVSFERPARIEYTITRGSPLKNHYGRIALIADDAGCQLDYHIEFDGKFPLIGAVVARNLRRDFTAGLAALAQELP